MGLWQWLLLLNGNGALRATVSGGSLVLPAPDPKQVFRRGVLLLQQNATAMQAVSVVICLAILTLAECSGDTVVIIVYLIVGRLQGLVRSRRLPARVVVGPPLLLLDIGRLGDLLTPDELLH